MGWKIITILFSLVESWLDRKGEKKTGKIKDGIWLTVFALIYCFVTWKWLDQNPFIIAGLILAWRVCIFDYTTNFLLKRYSSTHKEKDINIWKYTGTSTIWWDQKVAKINWILRLFLRMILLGTIIAVIVY